MEHETPESSMNREVDITEQAQGIIPHLVVDDAAAAGAAVRNRDDRISVTDGPFAETREQLAGFYLIEARDLNEAIRIAARIPPGRLGCIEVRPIRD